MWNGLTLKPEAKEVWLKALRSGEYQQGKSVLRNNNNYCCLGVFAMIKQIPHEDMGGSYNFQFPRIWENTTLPTEWFEQFFNYEPLRDAEGEYRDKNFCIGRLKNELIEKNDGTAEQNRHTFNQIANWIELHL